MNEFKLDMASIREADSSALVWQGQAAAAYDSPNCIAVNDQVPIRRIPEGVSGLPSMAEKPPKPIRLLPPHLLPDSGNRRVHPLIESTKDDE